MSCCPSSSEPFLAPPADHVYGGVTEHWEGLETYLLKGSDRAVVLLADVWGIHTGLHKLLADHIHKATGFTVVLPDLFHGDPPFTPDRPFEEQKGDGFAKLFAKYLFPQVSGDLLGVVFPRLREVLGAVRIGVLGFCYGGYLTARLLESGEVHAGASAHSAVWALSQGTKEDAVELFRRSKCPVMMLNAGNDPAEQGPGGVLQQALPLQHFVSSVFEEFPDMVHGWTVRGEATPETLRDRERAVGLLVGFFQRVLQQ
jgi:dienelactone hydrolase